MRFFIVNGPNLNWLGRREPEIYGELDWQQIEQRLRQDMAGDLELEIFQANGEGEIIDILQQADGCDGIVLNPGAYGHYSLAIADALAALSVPVVEVHLSNVFAREEIRHRHVTAARCAGYICGLGWRGYILALQALMNIVKGDD